MNRLDKTDFILLISFATLIIFPLLYLFRALDDNTLTSWRWVFSGMRIELVFGMILGGLAIALPLSTLTLSERKYPAVLLLLSFCAVIPLWGIPEVLIDTSRYFLQAKEVSVHGIGYFFREWGSGIGAWTDLPLVPFFYGLIFKYLGESRIYIQLFMTLLFSLTVLFTYRIGTTLWDEETGFTGGLLLLGIPYLMTQVPLMLVDVPAMFLLTLATFTFLVAVEKGGVHRILIAALVIFLAVLSKYSLWLMLLVLPVIPFSAGRSFGKTAFFRSAAILTIAGVLSGAVLLAAYDTVRDQIHLLRTYQWSGLQRWQESFVSTFFFQSHPFIGILALFGMVTAVRKREKKFLIPGWFAAFIFILHVERIRYILPLFPFFTLMASYGLQQVQKLQVRRFIAYSTVATALVVAVGVYLPFLNTTSMANLRHAGKYLDTLNGETVEVRSLPQIASTGNTEMAIPLLDLYTKKKLSYLRTDHLHPGIDAVNRSSLRFTWEVDLPEFYRRAPEKAGLHRPLAIIASGPVTVPPRGMMPDDSVGPGVRQFTLQAGPFRYRTTVSVFEGNGLAVTAHALSGSCPIRDNDALLTR